MLHLPAQLGQQALHQRRGLRRGQARAQDGIGVLYPYPETRAALRGFPAQGQPGAVAGEPQRLAEQGIPEFLHPGPVAHRRRPRLGQRQGGPFLFYDIAQTVHRLTDHRLHLQGVIVGQLIISHMDQQEEVVNGDIHLLAGLVDDLEIFLALGRGQREVGFEQPFGKAEDQRERTAQIVNQGVDGCVHVIVHPHLPVEPLAQLIQFGQDLSPGLGFVLHFTASSVL